jgi:hypothetical protein
MNGNRPGAVEDRCQQFTYEVSSIHQGLSLTKNQSKWYVIWVECGTMNGSRPGAVEQEEAGGCNACAHRGTCFQPNSQSYSESALKGTPLR